MKRSSFVSIALLLSATLAAGVAYAGDLVKAHFQKSEFEYPVHFAAPTSKTPTVAGPETPSHQAPELGEIFISGIEHLSTLGRDDLQAFMPEAEAFRLSGPFIFKEVGDATYLATSVEAFGEGPTPSKATEHEGGGFWFIRNTALYEQTGSSWSFKGWMH